MIKDLGVWTAADCALVLIDYQPEMFEVIRSETGADLKCALVVDGGMKVW